MKTQRLITIVSTMILGVAIVGCSKRSVSSDDQLLAESYRHVLPRMLKLKPEQFHVDAGAGFADVSILGVTNEADRQQISAAISEFIKQNPKADPIKLKFE
jgi:hypothetical protein